MFSDSATTTVNFHPRVVAAAPSFDLSHNATLAIELDCGAFGARISKAILMRKS
jgi:hypothetical protein